MNRLTLRQYYHVGFSEQTQLLNLRKDYQACFISSICFLPTTAIGVFDNMSYQVLHQDMILFRDNSADNTTNNAVRVGVGPNFSVSISG